MLSLRHTAVASLSMAVFCLPALSVRDTEAREALWIEGEKYVSSSFNRHSWYQNTNIAKGLLSPGTPGISDGGRYNRKLWME